MHVYAPNSSSSEKYVEAFYNHIDDALAKTGKQDIITLTGDYNAKIGNDNTAWKSSRRKHGYSNRNERGK